MSGMSLSNRIELLILPLIWKTCLSGIVIEPSTSEQDSRLLLDVAVDVMKTWQDERQVRWNTIGIIGNPSDNFVSLLSSDVNNPYAAAAAVVVLGSEGASPTEEEEEKMKLKKKLWTIATMTSRPETLRDSLARYTLGRWWNHMGSLYIIGTYEYDTECRRRAYELLSIAWTHDILEAVYFCRDKTAMNKTVSIYSFNPYAIDAPEPWKIRDVYRDARNHSWTLLVRDYSASNRLDDDRNNIHLHFDRTKDMGGGYPICGHVNTESQDITVWYVGNEVVRMIGRELRATVKLAGNDSLESFLRDCQLDRMDIHLMDWVMDKPMIGDITYPHAYTGIHALTRYRGERSQLSKIVSLLDVKSRLGLCLVFVATIAHLRYSRRSSLAEAILDTVKLFCNGGLEGPPPPRATSSRLYLAALFILLVTILGIYQGILASLLAMRVPLPDVETIDDLAESRHARIWVHRMFRHQFGDSGGPFEGRLATMTTADEECASKTLVDPEAACVDLWRKLVPAAAKFHLHLSRDSIAPYYVGWLTRDDWPLYDRVNRMIQRLVDTNVVANTYDRLVRDYFGDYVRAIEDHENADRYRDRKILSLDDLSFAFVILGIGLSLATLVFLLLESRLLPFPPSSSPSSSPPRLRPSPFQ